ncbi:holo-ACP synthase [Chitinasiproducens palmae]|uniref:Holo-[acyl-carrier-protein] synthase n=1 Tax=Chitinasiproducens palmae TaxID=1770053 RepID=A0A1H2PUW5_9BURK|nr:holo-ACP synthase [Chitinasiproducens palmae]SDV50995.1 holo-[acyl-carrier protein] synthase [Chitinasiproducens palmae]
MIAGIGTDLIEIARIAATLERTHGRFAQRVLGPDELAVYEARTRRLPRRGLTYLATRFAAKEAFSKAIGLGMRMPMTWRAMQTLNARSGAPQVVLSGVLADWVAERGLRFHVSLTDEREMAVAFVVAERD